MRTVYGRAWNSRLLVMGGVVTEGEARRRFDEGGEEEWFAVAAYAEGVPDGAAPEYSMEVNPGRNFISVSFHDQLCRIRFKFLFLKHENGMMFLTEIFAFRYPDESTYYTRSGCVTNTNYRYRPDGSMHWRRTDKVANVTEQADYRDIDVSTHWEPVPEFGEWASITRFDRTTPAS
ncbi:hypothetical protein [Microbacterium proteolyticum]|uniref:hypothetical protein n=1 Tax=Microbacterium proteolyticum TaxID=1572644 RepID=UPI002415CA54|nr:hypothetical protein [Microbacterium proteolyticum]